MISQGEIWWADLGEPVGSEPGYRRPVLIIQSDAFNLSRIRTVVCVVLTSQIKWATAPGNVLLRARGTRLDKDSVANVSQIVTLDKDALIDRVGTVTAANLEQIVDGVSLLLGRIERAR